jgi:hypothetical protein
MGFEPTYDGFANRCLTTWLPRHPEQPPLDARPAHVPESPSHEPRHAGGPVGLAASLLSVNASGGVSSLPTVHVPVSNFGARVSDFAARLCDARLRVPDFGARVSDTCAEVDHVGARVPEIGARVSDNCPRISDA